MTSLTALTSLRLRRTFRYPEELNNEDETRVELDEEEQEAIVQDLHRRDEQGNTQYKLAFTILPLVATGAFLPIIRSPSSSVFQKLLCFLGISSLLFTSYMMRLARPPKPDRNGKQPMGTVEVRDGGIERYLSLINAGVCVFLFLAACLLKFRNDGSDSLWILYLVPGLVFQIAFLARKTILSVDIGQLEALRYEYKGA